MTTPLRNHNLVKKIGWALSLLAFIQLSVACSTRTNKTDDENLDTTNSPFPTGNSGDVDDFNFDDFAEFDQSNLPPDLPEFSNVSGFEEECLSNDPQAAGCIDTSQVSDDFFVDETTSIGDALMFQSLNSFKYMNSCFQQVADRAPNSSSQFAVDNAFVEAQIGLVNCYQWIYGNMIAQIPWATQQMQPMIQQRDQGNYMQLLMLLMSEDGGF